MKLGYELTVEQTQKLAMTPELIQAIKILQLNNMELKDYVETELLENPVLEVNHEISDGRAESIDYRDRIVEEEYDEKNFRQWENTPEKQDRSFEEYTTQDVTLRDHLLEELKLSELRTEDQWVGRVIIGALDDNGYLQSSVSDLAAISNVTEEKVEEVLKYVQQMDPLGVGARNLAECLVIQLREKGRLTADLQFIIENMLEDVAANRVSRIAKKLGLSSRKVQDMIDQIKELEPKPGRQFAGSESTRFVVPDVIVEKEDGEYVISSNDGSMPRLMVSSYYKKLRSRAKEDADLDKYLTGRFNSAVWLIRSIEQRKQTILNVATAIVHYQSDYFERGEKYLRTLTLRQIAEELNIHESTVSRAINGKYMQSPRGFHELRYFFSSGVPAATGEGVSSNSIKSMIKDMIDAEDSTKPLSDQDMVKLLKEKGITISRRTVAKYREEMGILSSPKRRRY